MLKEEICKQYSQIISETKFRNPNYLVISFEKYLKIIFPNHQLFIHDLDTRYIRETLLKRFNNDNDCFKENGLLSTLEFKNLKYYQDEVGINGPMHSDINDPVYIIRFNNNDILYNGYHRGFQQLLKGQRTISTLILEI